jgi:phage N-6-adenine-methyltransferase
MGQSLLPGFVAKPLTSSNDERWRTPRWIFDRLNLEFQFGLDAAADRHNALCARWIDQEADAFATPWSAGGGSVWCNPPYSRKVGDWIARGRQQAQELRRCVVMLVFARTDTHWWHDEVMAHADEVRFVRGRLHFGHPDTGKRAEQGAGAPSAVIVFDTGSLGSPDFSSIGRRP